MILIIVKQKIWNIYFYQKKLKHIADNELNEGNYHEIQKFS